MVLEQKNSEYVSDFIYFFFFKLQTNFNQRNTK